MSDFALRISRIKKTHIIRPEVEGIERPEAREALRGADTPTKGLGWAVGGQKSWMCGGALHATLLLLGR